MYELFPHIYIYIYNIYVKDISNLIYVYFRIQHLRKMRVHVLLILSLYMRVHVLLILSLRIIFMHIF